MTDLTVDPAALADYTGMDSAARLLGAHLIESEVRDGIRWDEYATVIDGVSVRITAHEDGVTA